MISKKGHPQISTRDRIVVEGQDCVVSQIHGDYSVMGACEVVTNADCPECRDVCWDGQKWLFSPRPSFVEAAKCPRLRPFIALL